MDSFAPGGHPSSFPGLVRERRGGWWGGHLDHLDHLERLLDRYDLDGSRSRTDAFSRENDDLGRILCFLLLFLRTEWAPCDETIVKFLSRLPGGFLGFPCCCDLCPFLQSAKKTIRIAGWILGFDHRTSSDSKNAAAGSSSSSSSWSEGEGDGRLEGRSLLLEEEELSSSSSSGTAAARLRCRNFR